MSTCRLPGSPPSGSWLLPLLLKLCWSPLPSGRNGDRTLGLAWEGRCSPTPPSCWYCLILPIIWVNIHKLVSFGVDFPS